MTYDDTWSLGVPAPIGDVRCPRCKAAAPAAQDGRHRCGCGARETVVGPAVSSAELSEMRRDLEELTDENARLRAENQRHAAIGRARIAGMDAASIHRRESHNHSR